MDDETPEMEKLTQELRDGPLAGVRLDALHGRQPAGCSEADRFFLQSR